MPKRAGSEDEVDPVRARLAAAAAAPPKQQEPPPQEARRETEEPVASIEVAPRERRAEPSSRRRTQRKVRKKARTAVLEVTRLAPSKGNASVRRDLETHAEATSWSSLVLGKQDLTSWIPGSHRYDVVLATHALYLSPVRMLGKLLASVTPGGVLVVRQGAFEDNILSELCFIFDRWVHKRKKWDPLYKPEESTGSPYRTYAEDVDAWLMKNGVETDREPRRYEKRIDKQNIFHRGRVVHLGLKLVRLFAGGDKDLAQPFLHDCKKEIAELMNSRSSFSNIEYEFVIPREIVHLPEFIGLK